MDITKKDYPDNMFAYVKKHFGREYSAFIDEVFTENEFKEGFESFFSDMKQYGKRYDPRGGGQYYLGLLCKRT